MGKSVGIRFSVLIVKIHSPEMWNAENVVLIITEIAAD